MKNNLRRHRENSGFTLVEIMIVVVIIGLLVALAVPGFQKVRQVSQDKAIINNLRQIVSAAQQYMLDEGVTIVTTSHIMGRGLHMSGLSSVAGETYDISVGTDTTRVQTESASGRIVSYEF